MKITIEASATIDNISKLSEQIPARIWRGTTEAGVPIKVWVALIQPQTHDEKLLKTFDDELRTVPAHRSLTSFDVRLL